MTKRHNQYAVPFGKVQLNKRSLASTMATPAQRAEARKRSQQATRDMHVRLSVFDVRETGDGAWAVVVRGSEKVRGVYATVGEAIASLSKVRVV